MQCWSSVFGTDGCGCCSARHDSLSNLSVHCIVTSMPAGKNRNALGSRPTRLFAICSPFPCKVRRLRVSHFRSSFHVTHSLLLDSASNSECQVGTGNCTPTTMSANSKCEEANLPRKRVRDNCRKPHLQVGASRQLDMTRISREQSHRTPFAPTFLISETHCHRPRISSRMSIIRDGRPGEINSALAVNNSTTSADSPPDFGRSSIDRYSAANTTSRQYAGPENPPADLAEREMLARRSAAAFRPLSGSR